MKYELSEDHFLFMKFISGPGKKVEEFYAYNPPNKIWSEQMHTRLYLDLFEADVIDKSTFRRTGENSFTHQIFKLNEKGELLLFNYIQQTEREAEEKELQFQKLKYDVKNAKRIFKTYWVTFGIAVAGLLISLVLLIFRLVGK